MTKKLTTEEFIERATAVHGNKYDYSLVEYKGGHTNVRIVCPLHGEFEQHPFNHLKGASRCCSDSNKKARISFCKFIELADKIHGDKYIYGDFTKVSKKLSIFCTKHGVFRQSGTSHLQGNGCIKCHAEKLSKDRSMPFTKFVEKSNAVHNFKYSYLQDYYYNGDSRVQVSCPVHGIFLQVAEKHLSGCGCPKCARKGFRRDISGYLYLLFSGDVIKVGITNKEVSVRLDQIHRTSPFRFEVVFYIGGEGELVYRLEKEVLSWARGLYRNPDTTFDGHTECFISDNIPLFINKIYELKGANNGN